MKRFLVMLTLMVMVFGISTAKADTSIVQDAVGLYLKNSLQDMMQQVNEDIAVGYAIKEDILLIAVEWPEYHLLWFTDANNKETWMKLLDSTNEICKLTYNQFKTSFEDVVVIYGYTNSQDEAVILGYASAVLGIEDKVFTEDKK